MQGQGPSNINLSLFVCFYLSLLGFSTISHYSVCFLLRTSRQRNVKEVLSVELTSPCKSIKHSKYTCNFSDVVLIYEISEKKNSRKRTEKLKTEYARRSNLSPDLCHYCTHFVVERSLVRLDTHEV